MRINYPNEVENVEEISLDESSVETVENIRHIEDRECPTPLPENVYICGESNKGFTIEGAHEK